MANEHQNIDFTTESGSRYLMVALPEEVESGRAMLWRLSDPRWAGHIAFDTTLHPVIGERFECVAQEGLLVGQSIKTSKIVALLKSDPRITIPHS